jgi:hypothetical protein
MKTRAAILVGLLWTVVAVNGCASGGPEPNGLTLKQGVIEAGTGGTMAGGAHSIAQWTDF